jgi:DNA-binding transcriptional ArsR family regulator
MLAAAYQSTYRLTINIYVDYVFGVDAIEPNAGTLDLVFGALADPVRRAILSRLDGEALLVGELAAPFDISLQAVSRHIQVLVRAGLVSQQRTGRISRCRLDTGPILEAALWLNRYSKYWQEQFETLAMWLDATSPTPKEEDPHAVSGHDKKAGGVPKGDRRAPRQDARPARGRRTPGGR